MESANNFIVLNIREYLANEDKRLGEDKLVQLLSEFSCPLNPDVERFLKKQAIDFAKKHQAVTYLVLSLEDAELLGYFSITIKPLVVKAEPFSNTAKRKLARFSEIDKNEQTYNLAAYLIAQLGKNFNDKVKGRITGQELLEAAIRQTQIEISYIQRDLITVIFYYQISLKPLKTLSLSQVSFPLLFPLYYIVPPVFTNSDKGKYKGKKIL